MNGCNASVIKISADAPGEDPEPAATTYTVHFDGNGATSGSTDDVTGGDTVQLPLDGFTRDGYQFASWNSQPDGTGTSYEPVATVGRLADAGETVTLYAIWKSDIEAAWEEVDAAHARLKSAIEAAGGDYEAYMTGTIGFFQSMGDEDAVDVIRHTGYSDTDDQGRSFTGFTHVGQVRDATSLYNMDRDIDLVRGLNEKRDEWNAEYAADIAAGTKTRLGEVRITNVLMAVAEDHANWSSENIAHASRHGSPYWTGENLAWGYRDPFTGWYDEEKAIYDRGTDENGNYEDGVGHYLVCINGDYDVAGGAWNSFDRTSCLALWWEGAALEKSDGTRVSVGTAYSVDDYQARFDAYYDQVTGGADITELEGQANLAEIDLRHAELDAAQG